MKVPTTRFGELEVEKKDILTFPEGPLGFERFKKFFVIDPGDNTLILWIQSIEDASVAFPVIEPKIFRPDYTVKLMPAELSSLALDNINEAIIYSILTIPQDITQMSANLKAPIVINTKNNTSRQIVLQDNKLEVNYPMYKELKQYIVGYSSDDSKRTQIELADSPQENSKAPLMTPNPRDNEGTAKREKEVTR